MQITRAGEYAVLGVTFLVRKGADRAVMMDELCEAESIPKSFLAKIFQTLSRAGLVRSQRGVRGGFRLTRDPETITVLEILEAIEGKLAFQRCLEDPVECHKHETCTLCDVFTEAQHRVKEVFQNTTIADLTKPKSEVLRRVRNLGRAPTGNSQTPFNSTVRRSHGR